MKRISTAAVAAATALSLATVPAMAQEAETNQTAADQTAADQPAGQPEGETDQQEGETNQQEGESDQQEGESDQPADQGKTNQGKTNQGKTNKSSGSSQGTLVGVFAGTFGAVLTTALIVFSDPRGANKIVDMVNAQFGLGLPHLHTPKVELPNFQLPNLPF